jgi:Uma2 family endonuclease
LVVEILSDSDRQRVIGDKLADYIRLGVEEAWIVRPEDRTVELLRLTMNGSVSAGVYDETQTFASLTFPDLVVTVTEIFRP